ncbi:MAG: hypothetical protein SFU91_06220 [Chloroherpetonaceae bacterium]|nr:hypothetical protein [Chloroherpetonaceae bacterium]
MKDYSKLLPHLDAIKQIVAEFEGDEKEMVLRILIEDALSTADDDIEYELVEEEFEENDEVETDEEETDLNEFVEESEDIDEADSESDFEFHDEHEEEEENAQVLEDDDSDLSDTLSKTSNDRNRGGSKVKPSIENVRAFLNEFKLNDYAVRAFFAVGDSATLRVYTSLGTNVRTRAQIKAALLGCLAGAIETGDFRMSLKRIRQDCKDLGIYDSNFPSNIARAHEYFLDTGSKKDIELSDAGIIELASILKNFNEE